MKKLNINIAILSSVFMLLLSLISHSIHAQVDSNDKIDADARNNWVKQAQKTLKEINPENAPKKVELYTYERADKMLQKYRIIKAGLIVFNSNDWIYITLHSQHDNKQIGDLAIAINQDGKYYYHLGHVCGGIVHYMATSKTLYTSSKDFFRYFKDDTNNLPWHRLKKNSIPVSP